MFKMFRCSIFPGGIFRTPLAGLGLRPRTAAMWSTSPPFSKILDPPLMSMTKLLWQLCHMIIKLLNFCVSKGPRNRILYRKFGFQILDLGEEYIGLPHDRTWLNLRVRDSWVGLSKLTWQDIFFVRCLYIASIIVHTVVLVDIQVFREQDMMTEAWAWGMGHGDCRVVHSILANSTDFGSSLRMYRLRH